MLKLKRRFPFFYFFLILWVILFLTATAFGLRYLWHFLESYENSRPHIATNAYMDSLTVSHICEKAAPSLLSQIDKTVQSEQQARSVMEAALQGEITCTKWTNKSDDETLVYVLRCGPQIIGSVTLSPGQTDKFGFAPWHITEESFDLSFLLREGSEMTVPSDAVITVGGNQLGKDNVVQSDIRYDALSGFYDSYTPPTLTHYRWGMHLGELSVTVTTSDGVPLDPEAPVETFLDNCTDEEKAALDIINRDYLTAYIHFTSKTGDNTAKNLAEVRKFVVSDGSLDKRLKNTVSGLYWVSDRHVQIESITIHRYTKIGSGKYLCFVTYVVNTNEHTGQVRLENNEQIVFTETDDGLRAEYMISA